MSVTAHSWRFSGCFLSLLSFIRILSRVTDTHISPALGTQRSVAPSLPTGDSAVSLTNGAGYALARHWPEYLMEGAELGIFMISACVFTALLEYPASPALKLIPNSFVRNALIGLAMALTAVSIIYSGWGKQSGAHMNPAMTLTFFRLGKMEPWDAFFYVIAQFAGGVAGVAVASLFLGMLVAHPSVNYAVTRPGPLGVRVAFVAELLISFVLLLTVLTVSNSKKWARYTGLFGGVLIASYITFEAPLSGMSMNPARTFGSAFLAKSFDALWLYFVAPPIGMLAAAEVYVKLRSIRAVHCAKYHHNNDKRCIFRCHFAELQNPKALGTTS
ncbi:MAG TPA: aquaporin [Candidatus Acidoferrum sp.]|nr:aquaporin [Candidatus Acidoferrum sp.]